MVAVSGYVKKDGTEVRAHSRDAPGARRELAVLALVAAAVLALGGSSGGPTTAPSPDRPERTPVLRIVFPQTMPGDQKSGGGR
jgi:hypothetical protein